MTTNDRSKKLQALASLSVRSGIEQQDYHDIKEWVVKVGPDFDMWLLSDKTTERIDAIYDRFFE